MLSLLICSVSAFLLLWLRQHVAAVAWEAAAAFVRLMLACEAGQKSAKQVHAFSFYRSDASPEASVLLRCIPRVSKRCDLASVVGH